MAMPQNTSSSSSAPAPTKSNVWLIVIIILVVLAILWPILRRGENNGSEPLPIDSSLTSTTTVSDGTDTDSNVDSINLNLDSASESDSMTVRAYFGSKKIDPASTRCDLVYPVSRIVPRSSTVGRAALAALLTGPTPAEVAAGVFTSINPGVKLQSLTIAGGVARANFSQELGTEVGGACLTSAIRAQVTETLKQFSTVQSVVISIDGVSEGILEP